MKRLLFYFIIISAVFMNESSNILILSPYSTIDSNYLDENDVGTINSLFIEGFNQYMDNIETLDVSCFDDDCALEELSKTGNDEVVYMQLQKLGSKIIFSATILDVQTSFKSKITAMSVEDMENVCLRLSKSIALKQTLEEAADIENITQKEEQEDARRESLARIGVSIGYVFPNRAITYRDYQYVLGDDDTYRDLDEDGYYVTEGDCDESDAMTLPDSHEICDEVDNNCDGRIDEDLDCEDIEALE